MACNFYQDAMASHLLEHEPSIQASGQFPACMCGLDVLDQLQWWRVGGDPEFCARALISRVVTLHSCTSARLTAYAPELLNIQGVPTFPIRRSVNSIVGHPVVWSKTMVTNTTTVGILVFSFPLNVPHPRAQGTRHL